jgi:hypothetical protein
MDIGVLVQIRIDGLQCTARMVAQGDCISTLSNHCLTMRDSDMSAIKQ